MGRIARRGREFRADEDLDRINRICKIGRINGRWGTLHGGGGDFERMKIWTGLTGFAGLEGLMTDGAHCMAGAEISSG
jgi:hypothetical protein